MEGWKVTDAPSWSDELADALQRVAVLLNDDRRKRAGTFCRSENELRRMETDMGYIRTSLTGWRTVTLRYYADPALKESAQLQIEE